MIGGVSADRHVRNLGSTHHGNPGGDGIRGVREDAPILMRVAALAIEMDHPGTGLAEVRQAFQLIKVHDPVVCWVFMPSLDHPNDRPAARTEGHNANDDPQSHRQAFGALGLRGDRVAGVAFFG